MRNNRLSMSVLLALLLAGTAQAKLNVFACEPEWAALVKELAGDEASIFAATHAGQDPHHVEARPSLIARLRSADLAVCTGAELETGWMPMVQRRARNPKVLPGQPGYFEATDAVTLLEKPAELDRAEGDVHGDGNPHVQLDPRRILEIAKALSARLQQIDGSNSTLYRRRLQDFAARWQAALSRWQGDAGALRGRRVVVHHQEWTYLLDWLGMQRVGSLEPKPGIPPNMAHLAQLKQQPADLIVLSPLNDEKPAEWLTSQTGVPAVVLPQTVGAVSGSDDLFSLFDTIVRRLNDLEHR
ncbi:metal ABC transporter solute-binding protein, Zn/Mn family [Thiosocius teredinicola]|uniref:metal ABC transporter solute-binding protein, Zn/Mn family n=1 Tax=Thiosocius teredinicola TaxID=1973002 RepID=UPI002FE47ACD